jgi:hypothetical protein
MIEAGLNDLARYSLRDFNRFGNAAAFGHQSRHVRAGRYVPAFPEWLDVQPDCGLIHSDSLLTLSSCLALPKHLDLAFVPTLILAQGRFPYLARAGPLHQ